MIRVYRQPIFTTALLSALIVTISPISHASPMSLMRTLELPVFLEADNRTPLSWQSADGQTVKARKQIDDDAPGIILPCRMTADADRSSWDRSVEMNLATATGISLRLRVQRPEALRAITLYLRSGDGWYAYTIRDFGNDWQTVQMHRDAFDLEGNPAGWHVISAIRLIAWKGDGTETTVALSRLSSHEHRLVIIRNDTHAAAEPNDAWTINHYTRLAASWLQEAGIPAAIISDRRLADSGFPAVTRLALLPFNPLIDPQQARALEALVNRGGSIIACYTLPETLEPLLGVKHHKWMAAPKPDAFSLIQIAGSAADDGYPDVIHQESWNATIPTTTTARVIGTWLDGEGNDSAFPALTIDKGGAFIGHVLTNRDRERKTRLLAALIATLQPTLKSALAEAMLARADHFLHVDNREAVHALLMNEASRTGTGEQAQRHIESIMAYRNRTRELLATAPFGTLMDRGDVLRRMTATAYLETQPPFVREGEWRAVWAHEPDGLPGLTWETIAARISGYGITALFPNLLWPGRAYYPTPVYEHIEGAQGEPDRLTEVIDAARRHGLELHLWKVCFNLQHAPAEWVARLRATERLQVSDTGDPINWLCPSHPDNRQLELEAILDAATRYPIEGIHLDYIRYPGAHACFCNGCRKRFTETSGITIRDWPDDVRSSGAHVAAWREWRKNQITSWLKSVREAMRRETPTITLSAAVFPSPSDSRNAIGQDWANWISDGLVDIVTPMSYTSGGTEFQRFLDAQLPLATRRTPIFPGIGVSSPGLPVEQTAYQINLLRRAGAKGFILFQLDTDTLHHTLPALNR